MDAGQDLVATDWAAVAAAVIVAVPSLLVALMTLALGSESLDVPRRVTGTYLGEPVVLLVCLAAPLAAADLVGPSGNLVTVILVAGSVIAGELTFRNAWEPFLLARGRPVPAVLATVAALALGAAVTLLLARVLPAVVGPLAAIVAVPVVLVVAWRAAPNDKPLEEGLAYWLKDLTVDGDPVEIRSGGREVFWATRHAWFLVWAGPTWGHPGAGQVSVSWNGVFSGEGLLEQVEVQPKGGAESGDLRFWFERLDQGVAPLEPRWVVTGTARVLRRDGKRVLVS